MARRCSVFLCLLAVTVCLMGCATSVSRSNELSPGMSAAQVRKVMGKGPSQTQFVGNKLIWKYYLNEPWKGNIPYYLAFNRKTKKLESWYADEAEYMRQQQLWLQAFPPTQRHEVDVTGNVQNDVNVQGDVDVRHSIRRW